MHSINSIAKSPSASQTTPKRGMRRFSTAALISLVCGAAISATALGSSQQPANATVTLTSAQVRSISNTYSWLDRDNGIVSNTVTPTTHFVETPASKERSDYLNVKVKSATQMIEQITRDAARWANPAQSQTRGATNTPASKQAGDIAFANTLAQAQQRLVEARARLAPALREAYNDIDMHSVKIPAGVSAEVAAEMLMQTGDYEFVSIDWICYPTDTPPNDPLYSTQWHHAFDRIDSVGAWDFTQGSPDTIIGVCDSGVDLDHPDLAAALVPGYNAVNNLAQVDGGGVNDLNGHGSMVAGSAAAIGNNGTGIAGVGWNFGIMPIKVSNLANGTAFLSDILQGARWASDNGAYVANCSYGGAEDPATRSTGGHLRLEGHLLVFAAGNDGLANQTNDWENVTIVGASNQADSWVSWSHTGIGIDCIAPGINIRTTNRTGGYTYATGTSFSAPITSGALMLIHDANPTLSPEDVEYMLLNTCDDKQAAGQDNQTGWGRINIARAVEDAIFGPSIIQLPFYDPFPTDQLSNLWRNPIGDVIISTAAGPYALNLDDTDSIETVSMRTAFLAGSPAEISFQTQHRGVEAGETLTVEYLDILLNWSTLLTQTSDGSDDTDYTTHRMLLPVLGMHDGFKLRFAASGSDSTDDWYIDEVSVKEHTTNTLPWNDSFENGITLVFEWASSTATTTQNASNEPDGIFSAQLDNQDTMTSADVDVSAATSAVYMSFYSQHFGVENGETMLVEYKTILGTWNTLATITSDGVDQFGFELNQFNLPLDAYGGNTALRFTANGDEPDDIWYIDSVAITTEFIDLSCPGDLNDDGVHTFFDVSLFLQGFSAGEDYNGDGATNFFDVSSFLADYGTPCP